MLLIRYGLLYIALETIRNADSDQADEVTGNTLLEKMR